MRAIKKTKYDVPQRVRGLLDIPDAVRNALLFPCFDSLALNRLFASCISFYKQIRPILHKALVEKFLQAMLDSNLPIMLNILSKHPNFFSEKPKDYKITKIESRVTGRVYLINLTADESIFNIAQTLKLVDELEAVLPQIKNLSMHDMTKLKNSLPKALIQEEQRLLRLHYTCEYLLPVINALKEDKSPPPREGPKFDLDHIKPAALRALDHLREELFKPRTIAESLNIDQLLLAAYEACHYFDFDTQYHHCNVYAIRVIGLIKSLVNPSLGRIFCEGISNVIYDNQPIGEYAKHFRSSRRGDYSFYRAERNAQTGHGFDFLWGSSATWAIARGTYLVILYPADWQGMVNILKKYLDKKEERLIELQTKLIDEPKLFENLKCPELCP